MSRFPFDAVLFDCDGVLVDSEPLVARVLSEMLTARGWSLTPAQAGEVFLGHPVAVAFPCFDASSKRFHSREVNVIWQIAVHLHCISVFSKP